MKTEIFALALVMVVAFGATALPAMAAEDTSTGSFTLSNEAPVVAPGGVSTDIILYEADGVTVDTDGKMDPQTYYQLGVVVADDNTLEDLTEITVVIHDAGYTGDNTVDQQATYKWTPTGGWIEVDRPVGTNTWGAIVPGECTVPTLTGLSGEWKVKFKPGKVARETTWKATVTATDSSASDTEEKTGLSMAWYGELATEDESFGFSTVGLNAGPVAIVTPADNKIDFKAIANGNYKLQSETVDWESGNPNPVTNVTLDEDGAGLASGSFALKNYGSNAEGSANYVTKSSGTITGENDEISNYAEAGNSEPIFMWLYTASDGIMPYVYSGTYTLTLSNEA